MDFIWNDGGRSASGFVGTTGDCVTRAIAIATGRAYREVYDELGDRALKSPRNGIAVEISSEYLAERNWLRHDVAGLVLFVASDVPKGPVIVHITDERGRSGHLCTLIDQVVHDTWDPTDDEEYCVRTYWTPPEIEGESTLPSQQPKRQISKEQELTQNEFDKIMRRLRALDNTATNSGSTEGEKRNALRMMQSLLLTHNLSREDFTDDKVESVHFARIACPVNGRRASVWEKMLGFYLTSEIFPSVQWYVATKAHRTLFWFYGPVSDVENTIALFRELLLTIASAARLQYGSYVRGSGASYAEGYVQGLPRASATEEDASKSDASEPSEKASQLAVIRSRNMVVHQAARNWLAAECNVRLASGRGSGRSQHDASAARRGQEHGAKHQIQAGARRKGIPQR